MRILLAIVMGVIIVGVSKLTPQEYDRIDYEFDRRDDVYTQEELDVIYYKYVHSDSSVLNAVTRSGVALCEFGNSIAEANLKRTFDCDLLFYGTEKEETERTIESEKVKACIEEFERGLVFPCGDWERLHRFRSSERQRTVGLSVDAG